MYLTYLVTLNLFFLYSFKKLRYFPPQTHRYYSESSERKKKYTLMTIIIGPKIIRIYLPQGISYWSSLPLETSTPP